MSAADGSDRSAVVAQVLERAERDKVYLRRRVERWSVDTSRWGCWRPW